MDQLRAHLAACVVALALASCGPAANRLEVHPVESAALGKSLDFAILMPPAGPQCSVAALPVVYLLHGYGDDHLALDRTGLSDVLHGYMARGRTPCAILVLPDGERGFYTNWYDGSARYEDYIIDDLIPAAERQLGLEVPRERRHLMGVSMGGTGALQIGLRHPGLFASITSLSGVIVHEDRIAEYLERSPMNRFAPLTRIFGDGLDREYVEAHHPYPLVRRRAPELDQRIFIGAASREDQVFRQGSLEFHEHLAALGVDHEWVLAEGGHGWRTWLPLIERALDYVLGS